MNTFLLAAMLITPQPQTETITSITVDQAVQLCQITYKDYKRTGEPRLLHTAMRMLKKELRPQVALVCAGYGVGYEDAKAERQ